MKICLGKPRNNWNGQYRQYGWFILLNLAKKKLKLKSKSKSWKRSLIKWVGFCCLIYIFQIEPLARYHQKWQFCFFRRSLQVSRAESSHPFNGLSQWQTKKQQFPPISELSLLMVSRQRFNTVSLFLSLIDKPNSSTATLNMWNFLYSECLPK